MVSRGAGQELMLRESHGRRVDVMMCVFNGEVHLRSALDSILAQTLQDFSLIVVDDGSTDETPRILAEYADRDRRLHVIRNASNMGLVHARNRGLDACRASLMAVADADDLFSPDRLEKQVDHLDRHPELGFLGSNAVLIDQEGRQIPGLQQLPLDDQRIRFELLLGGCFWNTSTMYRTALIRQVGGYRAGFDGVEDYDLWSRLLEVTRAANLADRLVSQRVHANSFTATLPKVLRRQSRVSQHRLSAYLGRDVAENEAFGALTLFMYGWRILLAASDVTAALTLLEEVAGRADATEPPEVAAAFHRRVAQSLCQQARLQARANRGVSFRLACHAVRWDPMVIASRQPALLAASLAIPARAVEAVRFLKRSARAVTAPNSGRPRGQ